MKEISLHIMDIMHNCVTAGADMVTLEIDENPLTDTLSFAVTDNGRGMDEEMLARVSDPFFTTRTTRKIGMGIPLLTQNAQAAGGHVEIESEPGKGTRIEALFHPSNIDCPPMGDLPGSFILMLAGNPHIGFTFRYRYINDEFCISSSEIAEALEGTPVNTPAVIRMLTEMIRENICDLKSGTN